MPGPHLLTPEQLAALQNLDTCMVSNAVEAFNVRLRNHGYMDASVHRMTSLPQPLVGYAATLQVQTSNPPMSGHHYVDSTDWWDWLAQLPRPVVLVIEDTDPRPGKGAFVGEIHSAIFQALGAVGIVTNGAVRDIPAVQKMGFHLFANSVSVSHAFAHKVDFGKPVKVGGLEMHTGDIIHADLHGVVTIPPDVAAHIPQTAERILSHEKRILEECRQPHASIERLRDAVKGYFPA